MKVYADLKAHAQERKIEPREVVLMRQPKKNKLTTPYNPKPFVREVKKGSMVTASNGSQTVTRNLLNLKLLPRILQRSKRIVKRKMKKTHQEWSKTLQKPRKTFR